MKTFDEIYEELQSKDNNGLKAAWEEAKKESEKANKISLIVCLIMDILIISIILRYIEIIKMQFEWMPIIIAFILANCMVILVVSITFSEKHNNYIKIYKETVINSLISNFYDNLEYYPNKEMPKYIYNDAKYKEHYDRYSSEDYMEAQINNKYNIQMAEVLTQAERTYTDSDGNTHTETVKKFDGLFAKIIMHKSIKGYLRVEQNGTHIFDKKRLEMDSSEFEKYFDVKASDKILAMRILTADIMEELIEFQDKTHMEYDVYINENEIYLRFHHSGSLFEVGNLKAGPIDKKKLKEYFYILNFTYNLSNKLINLVNEIEI